VSLSGLFDSLRPVPRYRALIEALRLGGSRRVSLLDSAKPYVLASLWRHLGRPMLVVCPRPDDARKLLEQLEAYCGEDDAIFHFAESEVLPYERLALDASTTHQRISALGAIRGHGVSSPPLIVASVMALMQRTLSPGLLDAQTHTVALNQKLQLEPLLQRWAKMGYRIEPAVEEPGTMSRRGGIIDIFPPGQAEPARIELWGDRVDSIRRFDIRTQRSTGELKSLTVLPAAEVLPALSDSAAINEAVRALDFSNAKTAERDRVDDDLAELLSGLSMDNASFYAGFFHRHTLLDFVKPGGDALVVLAEAAEAEEAARHWEAEAAKLRLAKQERGELPIGFPSSMADWASVRAQLDALPGRVDLTRYHATDGDDVVRLPFTGAPNFSGRLEDLAKAPRLNRLHPTVIATQYSQRIAELMRDAGIGAHEERDLKSAPQPGEVTIVHGGVASGWTLLLDEETETPVLNLLSDAELFGTAKRRPTRARTRVPAHQRLAIEELTPGQYVVHIDHGIGNFVGTTSQQAGQDGAPREYLVLEYAEGDKLYVPMEHLDRVSAYMGGDEAQPSPTRLGTQEWSRTVARARESTKKLAVDLLAIYAQREMADGHAFSPDSPWQREMEDAFPYVETPDQAAAIDQVKADMEQVKPMDRLVCGDVGYGKTEVALRAAFKAVMDGKQVAVLVPTTVLAQQHYATFTERLRTFPARIETLSRFRSPHEQDEVIERLKKGEADIVIGTHRLVQKDVAFRDLGLVIIDEEHRFGVNHKERLRDLRKQVDVLTLTATPIPRTLYMAMSGVRDISTIETAPQERQPIKTFLAEHSDDLVREAILREMDRGGQVFYLHNRVKSIDLEADHIRQLVPEARVAIAHGQMAEEELERVMAEFADGEADVLVCTTIIESGLDIPTVNTLIVDHAERLGLAQLYQLRGRIGRRSLRGYAYLFVPRGRKLTDTAQRRLQTIVAATELGAGFRIAMKDLEIRGAGNILGAEQSGQIHAVGFDLYTRLLGEAVRELQAQGRGAPQPVDGTPDPQVDLGLPAAIPEALVAHMPTRMAIYQQMAKARTVEDVDALTQDLRDRFGHQLPEDIYHLVYTVRVRVLARLARVEAVNRSSDRVTLKLRDEIGGARIPLEKALGHGVKVGNQQLHLPLEGNRVLWGQALLAVLERLRAFQHALPELTAAGAG